MSRFEPNVEPSMEEILASIRKIIAEEPPGSRPAAPAPRSGTTAAAPSPAPQRGFMSREAFLRSSAPPEPEDEKPASAPATTAAPAKEQATSPAGLKLSVPRRDDSNSSASGLSIAADVPARPSPSRHEEPRAEAKSDRAAPAEKPSAPAASAAPAPESKTSAAPMPASKPAASTEPETNRESRTASIDAQLADLIADDLKTLNGAEHAAKVPGPAAPTAEKPASASPTEKSSEPEREQRPVFSPSRNEFANESAKSNDTADPFAFDLGPSPFLSRPAGPAPTEPLKPAPTPLAASYEPARSNQAAENKANLNGAAPHSPVSPSPIKTVPLSVSLDPAPTPSARSSEPFKIPSVAATLGPSRKLEPLSSAFQPAPAERQPSQPINLQQQPSPPPAETARFENVRDEPRSETSQASLLPSYPTDASFDRAIEDTVADLLRPMLRTWLAENMPKIVERALRREMTERFLPTQKKPLE